MVSIMGSHFRASFGPKKIVLVKSCLSFGVNQAGPATAARGVPYISIYGGLDSSGGGTDCGPSLRIFANLCTGVVLPEEPFRPRNGV